MSYTLPAAPYDSYRAWGGYQSRAFQPDERQRAIMAVIRQALDSGLYYTRDVLAHAAAALDMPADQLAQGGQRTEGGDFGMDCYYARHAIEAQALHVREDEAHATLQPVVGMKLGVLTFNDFKRTTGCTVTAVDGLKISFTGKRGSVTVSGKATALALSYAFDRAHKRGNRQTDFAQFVAEAAHV